MTRIITDGHG